MDWNRIIHIYLEVETTSLKWAEMVKHQFFISHDLELSSNWKPTI